MRFCWLTIQWQQDSRDTSSQTMPHYNNMQLYYMVEKTIRAFTLGTRYAKKK